MTTLYLLGGIAAVIGVALWLAYRNGRAAERTDAAEKSLDDANIVAEERSNVVRMSDAELEAERKKWQKRRQ